MSNEKTWAQKVYDMNYSDSMEIEYCLWLQCMLKEYEVENFPNGKDVMCALEWSNENMPYDKERISKLLNR